MDGKKPDFRQILYPGKRQVQIAPDQQNRIFNWLGR